MILRKECRGDGEVPYVVVDDLTPEQSTAARRAMDAWVAARLPPVATVGSARIYALPAEGPMPAPLVPESPLEPESTPE